MKNDLTIDVNGISTSYRDSEKNTTPVIFIHGFPFDKSSWDPQFDFLSETQRVITYDLPGFGKSAPLNQEVNMDSYADHLVNFMDALSIKKAIVCGLSMGGYILLNATERYPERLSAIVLSDTQCIADSKENAEKRYETIKKIEKDGLKEFAEGFLKGAFAEETHQTKKELVEKIRAVILSNSEKAITAALKAMAERKETCSGLKNISVPTLVICGEEDTLTPVTRSEYLFNHIPNAEMHVIKKAGHLSNLEDSEAFNDHLHNFISDVIL